LSQPCTLAPLVLVLSMQFPLPAAAQHPVLAPTGTLRIAYLASNPAQAVRDPGSGETRGVVIDLAGELSRRLRVTVNMQGLSSPQQVIEAVAAGKADIGFVAYNPERVGPVLFSQPYMLVSQTFIVPQGSPIRSMADIDRPNRTIGATSGDSIALYLARTLRRARLVELTGASPAEIAAMLRDGRLDAFGANRQRLFILAQQEPGLRVLREDLYAVEQAIVVSKDNAEALAVINQFIDEVRASGFLDAALARSGVVGLAIAKARTKP
jgi:polar amino acid transport system substrate-binding protein